ncbi:MAG: hypothetical protein COA41_02005 [Sphingopyxis sp.]|nr:MAG: hypothetical protein COA41_02005 [Sphingopyxis sp.]
MSESWTFGGASVIGSAHLRRSMPNQDAMAYPSDRVKAPRVILAISDGHGSAPHFRSGTGAQLAVAGAMAVLEWQLDAADDDAEADDSLAGDIVKYWQKSIVNHVTTHPFLDTDLPLLQDSNYIPYGATLLAVGADTKTAHLLQIGDGDVLVGFADGRIERPLRADEGLVGEETYSLCQDRAEQHFRVATLWRDDEATWPDFFLLASDGVSKSFRDAQGFEDAARQLRKLAHADFDQMLLALPAWLTALSANGSGDDSTLCVAVRATSDNANVTMG